MATGADKGANRGVNINNNNTSQLHRYKLEQEVSSLRLSHAELEYTLATTKCLIVEQKDDKRQLAIQHVILETDLDEQARRLALEMTRSTESKKEEERLLQRIAGLESESESLTSETAALRKQIEEKDAAVSTLESKIEKLEEKLSIAAEDAKEARNEAKGLKKDLTSAQKGMTTEEKASEGLKKEIQDLKQQLEEKFSEIKTFKKDLAAAKKEVTSESKASETAKKELQELQKSLDSKASEIDDLKTQLETISKELQSTKSQLNAKKKKSDDESTSKIAELDQTIKDLKAELKGANRTNKTLNAELESSNQEADAVTALTKERIALSRQLTTAQAENDALKAATDNHRELIAEKLQLTHQVEQLQVELENEKNAVKRAGKSKSDVDDIKQNYEKQLADLRDLLHKQAKATERTTKDWEKDRESWGTQRSVLEKKLENWKNKAKAKAKAVAPAVVPKGKKRGATTFDDDVESPPAKKTRKSTVAKSTFSTTPFLARHISVVPSEAESTPSKPDASEIETTAADSPLPFLPRETTEVTETESMVEEAPPAKDIKAENAREMMPPPPKPASKATNSKPAQKIFLSTTALKNAKPRAASIAPETSLLGDDEVEYMPKTSNAGKKKGGNKENNLPKTIAEEPEDVDGFGASPQPKETKPKKTRIRKLIGNTLGNTLFDDDGEDGTFNKFRAPSVTGFNKDFSPLKQRGAGFAGVKNKLVIKKTAKSSLSNTFA
ncbi:hypothetical protein DRE_04235 [Drechslerella stenobrocha 248]|uniref:Uncharacterized protein n=1 Tax=Drechslerella stenobrocha 248 TaxID=1043628 RepID=W7I2E1_9PEZI|nr:hypothetical protein DRE_04235 [Drechslerella stenobrocha 248]